ncbi:RING-H2 finger protein ATL63 [Gossypium australe]|uniref:RING-H2 finger protein ATL63 n=1 Tax=Gossypium australe TaxID=47621 RepID=A0A5B6WNQ4_9ROSI|nr:RING-H2 finger protein ATL63 [Gossypium australe]
MAREERTLRNYAFPNLDIIQGSIARPTIKENNFEIKPTMIEMIQNNLQFKGTMMEEPNQYLERFLQLCDTFKFNGVTVDAIRLRLFPFSLINKVFSCLDLQTPRSKFLHKLFRISKTILIQRCPHHGLPEWSRLVAHTLSGLNGAAVGALIN